MVVTKVEAVTKTKYKVYVDGQFALYCIRVSCPVSYSRRPGIVAGDL